MSGKPPSVKYFFTMIEDESTKQRRVGDCYTSERVCRNWLKLVKQDHPGKRCFLAQFTVHFDEQGRVTTRCRTILRETYGVNLWSEMTELLWKQKLDRKTLAKAWRDLRAASGLSIGQASELTPIDQDLIRYVEEHGIAFNDDLPTYALTLLDATHSV